MQKGIKLRQYPAISVLFKQKEDDLQCVLPVYRYYNAFVLTDRTALSGIMLPHRTPDYLCAVGIWIPWLVIRLDLLQGLIVCMIG